MSPRPTRQPAEERVRLLADRLASDLGVQIHDERVRRGWTMRELGTRSGVSASSVHLLEVGHHGSLSMYSRLALALGLKPEFDLRDERTAPVRPAEDPVHAWMGDVEAGVLQRHGFVVALDEPYQHFQFAGRGDVVAWSLENAALLHIENRTRFPNIQEAMGSYGAKRAYLAPALAERLKLRGGFRSIVHVIVGLWSAELMHTVRLRTATFRAACPDSADAFARWWKGEAATAGVQSTFVLFDPNPRRRSAQWIDLDATLRAEPRYRGYLDALSAMKTR